MTDEVRQAARLLGARGGSAGKGRSKRITPEEKARRAERMRLLRVSLMDKQIRNSTD